MKLRAIITHIGKDEYLYMSFEKIMVNIYFFFKRGIKEENLWFSQKSFAQKNFRNPQYCSDTTSCIFFKLKTK